MKKAALLAAALPLAPLSPLLAQIPIIPSVPAEQTFLPLASPDQPQTLANFRLKAEFSGELQVHLHPSRTLTLTSSAPDAWDTLDLQYEQLPSKSASFRATRSGKTVIEREVLPEKGFEGVNLTKDCTLMLQFVATGDGTFFAQTSGGKWEDGARRFALVGGKLVFEVASGSTLATRRTDLANGKPHSAVLRVNQGRVTLIVDGRMEQEANLAANTKAPGADTWIGMDLPGIGTPQDQASLLNLRFWDRALNDEESVQLTTARAGAVNTPNLNWLPPQAKATFVKGIAGIPTQVSLGGSGKNRSASVQPLEEADHAQIIGRWSEESLATGDKLYNTMCMTCHGTLTQEGSMPTSRHFQSEAFKNGNDPFRIFQTLTQGYGLMMAMPQYSAEQKYALIHYIRENFMSPRNKKELFAVTDAYLQSLPIGMRTLPRQEVKADNSRQFEKMNFGPMLEWTVQVGDNNIAYKAITTRLDSGDGGVTKGHAWAVFEHDTMTISAVTRGNFVDWKGVGFDGSHGTHLGLTGDRLFVNPVGPGWANPADGSWGDPRFRGRDGKPYGPLPREWAQYKGSYLHGDFVVQSYSIGDAAILECTEGVDYGKSAVFLRTLNVGKSERDLKVRVAPVGGALAVRGTGLEGLNLEAVDGFHVVSIPAAATPAKFRVLVSKGGDEASMEALLKTARVPLDLGKLTHGGPQRWQQVIKTEGVQGKDDGPFATDVITHPESEKNPWGSWMRLSGFDFFADGNRAAVCTFMGDVWIVEGVAQTPLGELKWRRIATGLFQPLGLKILKERIFVNCRDQIAVLNDLNGDGETDFIECFNNDQQVTEHFHEFTMGLDADAAGNLYYAKGARHALPAVVPQHGTLLRVSADGSRTDILASGLRAANGVCLNPDGTFFLTDQEGHWTPKNRINLVKGKGPSEFYGNMMGYHSVTDTSNAAMEQPVCWITNAFDRSPSELVWVPKDAQWGPLNGSLLNISYGYGKLYTVPFEQVDGMTQGGLCALPMPQFTSGLMRGRFHPKDGQFYGCGLFVWSSTQAQPGGFYRVRYTGKPATQPIGLHFAKDTIRVSFSDALAQSASEATRYAVKVWQLERSEKYGSQHVDEHPLKVTASKCIDEKTVELTVPDLQPTMSIEIACKIAQPNGSNADRIIHGTIHRLAPR